MVGLNHLGSSMACREKASLTPGEIPAVLRDLKGRTFSKEIAILSTCSRLEIVAAADDPFKSGTILHHWLVRRAGEEALASIYIKRGGEALGHLFRVTAGLDSWIIGETEILRQVKDAYQIALESGATGRILNRVFQKALAAGKAIRAETGIQNGIRSIGGAAALLAGRIFGSCAKGQVLVFGAGQAAEAVVRHLAAKEFSNILVASRNVSHAKDLAGRLGGSALPLEEGFERLSEAEIAIFSLNSPQAVLNREFLRSCLAKRRRPLFLIDLGLPRNIEADCAKLDGAFLYNLDDLKEIVRETMDKKATQKERAEAMAATAARECAAEFERRPNFAPQERSNKKKTAPKEASVVTGG